VLRLPVRPPHPGPFDAAFPYSTLPIVPKGILRSRCWRRSLRLRVFPSGVPRQVAVVEVVPIHAGHLGGFGRVADEDVVDALEVVAVGGVVSAEEAAAERVPGRKPEVVRLAAVRFGVLELGDDHVGACSG